MNDYEAEADDPELLELDDEDPDPELCDELEPADELLPLAELELDPELPARESVL